MTELDDLRALVAQSCRIIGRLHLTREPNGHVSARIPGSDLILIKARGAGESALSFVETDDLMTADLDGKFVDGREGLASPAEIYIHTQMYRARHEVNSVIHIHPASVVAFTIAEKQLLPIIGAYNPVALRLVIEGLPVYPRSILINSVERGDDLAKTMGTANACLMRGHGITTAGRSVEEATLTAIHLNDLAELQYRAETLGGAQPIPEEDLDEFRRMNARSSAGDTITRPPSSEWRYYERLYGGD
ncbi:MAG TPA: class II aldolase/adducin family protein [Dehalococcoidia bacterium]|nr:class II aldolase/adducin family protein [Dehalococcoidia bacterium]